MLVYVCTLFTSTAREGDRQRFGQITFKLRVATKCDHQQPGLGKTYTFLNQVRPKNGSSLEENSEVEKDDDFPINFHSFPSCFAHVTLFILAFRVFLHITPWEIFSSD